MKTKQLAKAVVSSGSSVVDSSTVVTPSTGGSSAQSGAAPVVGSKGFRAKLQQMLLGFQAVIPKDSSLANNGGALSQATVVAQLQSYLGSYAALDAADLAVKNARVTVEQQAAAAEAFYVQLKEALVGFFGSGSPQLPQFGVKPKGKRQPLPAAKKAAMVVQMLETRKLRGVMGKQAKAALKAGPVTVSYTPTSTASPVVAPVAAQDSAPTPVVAADSPPVSK